ncbi:MAG: hypothetical protein KGI75_27260 [Rhizobiaceae bacterium]|nr:hypothetical protein [Rhizobiaceae bacterium]
MDYLRDLAEWSTLAVAVVLLITQLVAHEIGYRLGANSREGSRGQMENVGVIVAGMLALLAFVLALTLSYSTTRFNERRQGALAEANAIGTAWLRANAIGTPQALTIAHQFEAYLKAREDFVQAGLDGQAIAKANQDTSALQQSIWFGVGSMVRERPDPVSASLMSAVNEAFDAGSTERLALEIRLPWQIFWLLVGVMHLAAASLGYQFGLRGKAVRILILLLLITWTSVIVEILDLASPRVGNFRTNVAVYEWTRQTIQQMGYPSTAAK